MMKKNLMSVMNIGLLMLVGCTTTDDATLDPKDAQTEEVEAGMNRVSSTSSVTTPDGDEVGESVLVRETDGITLNFEACCVTPGNAYTAWWLIGDVEKPMGAVKTPQATGWVADSEQIDLELILDADSDGIEDPYDGVRLAVLDHGPDIGDPKQLNTPGGGCSGMCPVIFTTSHAAQPITAETSALYEPLSEPPRTGDAAPDFTLPDSKGNMVSLADVLQDHQMVILVFYYSHT